MIKNENQKTRNKAAATEFIKPAHNLINLPLHHQAQHIDRIILLSFFSFYNTMLWF
jgi:hypothetical protein